MKKFVILLIVLMLATPVFASQSNMVSILAASSAASALSSFDFGADVTIAPDAHTKSIDTPFVVPSIAAFTYDFEGATSDNAPNSNLVRINELGASDPTATVIYRDSVSNDLYNTALYTTGSSPNVNAVLVTEDVETGALVAMKTLQFGTSCTYRGILDLGSGNYIVYGSTTNYWGSNTVGFAIKVSVSGNTYVINAYTLFWSNAGAPFNLYDAVYDSKSGFAVYCGMFSSTSQFLNCVSLDAATLSNGDAAKWDLPDPMPTDIVDMKVNKLEKPSADTQIFVSARANSPVQVYVVSFDLDSSGNLLANNWFVRSTTPSGYGDYKVIEDTIFDEDNNFVLSLNIQDTSSFWHGVVASLDPVDGSTVHSEVISDNNHLFKGLCNVGPYFGIASDSNLKASAYLFDTDGTLLIASETTGTETSDNAVVCGGIYSPFGIDMALGGKDVQGEALWLVNGLGTFIEGIAMTYGTLAFPPTTVHSILSSPDQSAFKYFSNNGIGGQDFDFNNPIPLVPEFSLATLLLAVLLAGGLVLFVVRRRP